MKRKILVFTPFIALLLAGCNFLGPRTPLPPTSGQSTSTKPTSTTTPTPVDDTYGTLDNPISVARAIEIGNAIAGASSEGTVYETKDAYIKGYVQSEPERGDTNEYRFNIADSYEATTNIQFYWGFVESGVSVPIVGDEVVVFGRLANYKTRTIELAGKKIEGEAGYEIEPPSVLKSNHVDCTITLGSYSHGTVTGVPATAVQNGTKVELVATPDEGYYVGSIKVYGQTLVEEGGKYSFTAYSSTTVSVEFVAGQKSALQEAYEAAIAAGTAGTTEEYTFTGVVVAITKNAFYVQDGKYGIYVYSSSAIAGIEVGKSVTVKATMKLYYGQVETASLKDVTVGSDADLPASVQVTSQSQLSGLNQNIRAHLTDAVLATKQEWSASKNCIATFTVGADTITVKFDKNAYKTDDPRGAVLASANVGDKIDLGDITPVPYNDNMQLVFTGTSTIVNKTTPSVVPVTGVKLNTDKLDFVLGGSAQTLTATVEPTNATNKKVSWSVNPTGIVTVNNGSVSPSGVGDAVVTVTTEDGNKTATCNVHVGYPEVSSVTVSPKTESLIMGEGTKTLTATVLPEQAKDRSVTWSVTSGGDYVSVDQQGVITPKAVGTAVVTATSNAKNTLSDSCTVTVTSNKVEVTSVTVSPKSLDLTTESQDTQLTATVEPNNASVKTVSWSVNPTGVVTVENGLVHVVAAGTAVVTVASTDNPQKSDTCNVTVTEVQKSSLQLAYEKGMEGDTTNEYTFTGVITAISGSYFYVQDGEYAIYVYKATKTEGSADAEVGKQVSVTAKFTKYEGLLETNGGSFTIGESGTVPAPTEVTTTAQLEGLNQSVIINLPKVVLASKPTGTWPTSGNTKIRPTVYIGDDTTTQYQVTLDRYNYVEVNANEYNDAVVGNELSLGNALVGYYGKNTSPTSMVTLVLTQGSTLVRAQEHATAIAFKANSYDVIQGSTKDMSEEIDLTPSTATDPITYNVSGNNGVTIDDKGVVTVAATATAESTATVTATISGLTPATCTIVVKAKPSTSFEDTLTHTFFGATGTTYASYGPFTSDNGISYSAQCAAGNDSIQLRSNNSNSGVIGGNAAYKIVSVVVTFESHTANGRKVDVYGSATAYESPASLYGDSKGTKLGSAEYDGETSSVTINVTDSYSFIGIRSNSGALYCSSIVITWAPIN